MRSVLLTMWLLLFGLVGCTQPPPAEPTPSAPAATLPPTIISATTTPPTQPDLPTATPPLNLPITPDLFRPGLISSAQSQVDQWPGATLYEMELTIADSLTYLSGRMTITYTNQENQPLTDFYLRLYPNIADGRMSLANVVRDGQLLSGQLELADSAWYTQLNPPLEPGQKTVFALQFEVTVPSAGGGNYGTFIFDQNILALAHFYPFVPVYDDEGWNVEIPSTAGDIIYGDSSFYLVKVTAPAEQLIAGSGFILNEQTNQNRQTIQFAAGPVRDFYLISSADFEPISAEVGETTITHYGLPNSRKANEEALKYAVDAFTIFTEKVGPYPFTELEIAASPTTALGVEYPTVIVNNLAIYNGSERLETTTAHEVGHQWFYSTVGNDQLDEPWLDESLTQYLTYLYIENTAGASAATRFAQSLELWGDLARQLELPLGLPVKAYEQPPAAYGSAIYGRGPLFFAELRLIMGEEPFFDFLKNYYQTYQFQIATTAGLQTSAEESCQCNLQTLFDQWVYEK